MKHNILVVGAFSSFCRKACRCKCFLWATFWTIFMLLVFPFECKAKKPNKNEFYGEMRNDKLWQMELKIYHAMCCLTEWMNECVDWEGRRKNEVALELYLQCNKCSPWTLNMHNNPFVFYPHCTTTSWRKPLFPCCCSESTTFYNFSFLFRSEQIALNTERNYFLIYFHFILLRWFGGASRQMPSYHRIILVLARSDYASFIKTWRKVASGKRRKSPQKIHSTPLMNVRSRRLAQWHSVSRYRVVVMVLTRKPSNVPKIARVEKPLWGKCAVMFLAFSFEGSRKTKEGKWL